MTYAGGPQYPGPDGSLPPRPPVPPPPAPKKRSKRRRKIVLSVFLVLVVVFFAAIWFFTRDNGENAQVGNCVTQSGENYVKIVDCGDPAASLKVVARIEDKTQDEAMVGACDGHPDAGSVFWEGKEGETGVVLCLAKTGK